MDVNKNTYTFGFAIIMVVFVAAILSFTSIKLKPLQDANIELEKKQNILSSIGVNVSREEANNLYDSYIREEIVLNYKGEEIEGSAFEIDLSKEIKKNIEDQIFPLFISEVDSKKKLIIPLRGKGLWGPIWGFLALDEDANKVFGAVFDHKAETPGLGAEINRDFFQEPFAGKKIFDDSVFVSIKVIKGGADPKDLHGVDGISGGTITSDGVTDMLYDRVSLYLPYLNNIRLAKEVEDVMLEMDSIPVINDSITY
jgi:Na+-transporting NADH:ubiquinone oxidoreductase subunit C